MTLKAPFPWFGGKSRVAPLVWEAFGEIENYVEPFFGSGAVLLGAPRIHRTETVNDKDGFVSNFWRALQADPGAVAEHADWPANENDLHARHAWLVEQREDLTARLEGDPAYYDAKIAGWWVWGIACWIGGGWCSGIGPWHRVQGSDGAWRLVKNGDAGQGVKRQLLHLGSAGQGVKRQRLHLGNAGQGVKRGRGEGLCEYLRALADRLANVRVCCGDWSRICGFTPTVKQGLTGLFLDPPYSSEAGRDMDLYATECGTVAHEVRRYCIERGGDPRMRIVLCGYDNEHDELADYGWRVHAWKAHGGYGNQSDNAGRVNATRERLWLSPHCLSTSGKTLFEQEAPV